MVGFRIQTIIKRIITTYNQLGVNWKVTNEKHYGESHLKRRQRRKEINEEWKLDDYNNLILNIMNGMDNDVHLYYLETFTQSDFTFNDGSWIVIVGENGVIETCMLGKLLNYFTNNPGYMYLGRVREVFE